MSLSHRRKLARAWLRLRLLQAAAWPWRRCLPRTTWIGVTGSVGKTTARRLLSAALAEHAPTAESFANQNDAFGVARSILRVRPRHRFAVIETATSAAGQLRRRALMLRPDLAVVVRVATTHLRSFPTLDDVAREKSALVRALRPGGRAVLNGDDPRVAAMAGLARDPVLFGSGDGCAVRLIEARAPWPERLRVRLRDSDGEHEVRTRLVGTHWAPSVLAAWAAARSCGVPPDAIARGLARVDPVPGRLQPVALPGGAVLLRDEGNGSRDTWEAALAVMAEARAGRRWLVAGGVTNARGSSKLRLRRLGERTPDIFDGVLFIGPDARHGALAARRAGLDPAHIHECRSVREASEILRKVLVPDDLVLLKGRATQHLSRLCFALQGEIACWREDCRRLYLCDVCPRLCARTALRPVAAPSPPLPVD